MYFYKMSRAFVRARRGGKGKIQTNRFAFVLCCLKLMFDFYSEEKNLTCVHNQYVVDLNHWRATFSI